jgi:hypothetical protein
MLMFAVRCEADAKADLLEDSTMPPVQIGQGAASFTHKGYEGGDESQI